MVQIEGALRLDIPLHHSLKTEIDRILSNCDLIWVNWRRGEAPDHALALLVAIALTRAAGLGDELVSGGVSRIRDNDATPRADEIVSLEALRMVGDELETAATEIIRAPNSRATKVPGNPKEADQKMH